MNEVVTLNGTVTVDPAEFLALTSVKLTVAGPSPFAAFLSNLALPMVPGTTDMTGSLPKDGSGNPLGTLSVTVTYEDIVVPPGGYGYGYVPPGITGKIKYTLKFKPPIKKYPVPVELPFPNEPNKPLAFRLATPVPSDVLPKVKLFAEIPLAAGATTEPIDLTSYDAAGELFLLVQGDVGQPDKILALNEFDGSLIGWADAPNDQAQAITFGLVGGVTPVLFVSYLDGGLMKVEALDPATGFPMGFLDGQAYPVDSPVASPTGGMAFDPWAGQLVLGGLRTPPGSAPVYLEDPLLWDPFAPTVWSAPLAVFGGADGYSSMAFEPYYIGAVVGVGGNRVVFQNPGDGSTLSTATVSLTDLEGVAYNATLGRLIFADGDTDKLYYSVLPAAASPPTPTPHALAGASSPLYVAVDGAPADFVEVIDPAQVVDPNAVVGTGTGLLQTVEVITAAGTSSDQIKGATVVGSNLYLADNSTYPPSLWKFAILSGGTLTTTPVILAVSGTDVDAIGALATYGGNILAVEESAGYDFGGGYSFTEYHVINPATGNVIQSVKVNGPPGDPNPDIQAVGADAATVGSNLFIMKGQTFQVIDPTDVTPPVNFLQGFMAPAPPSGVEGLGVDGNVLYYADIYEFPPAVYKGFKPGAVVEKTSVGLWTATLIANVTGEAPVSQAKSFEVRKVTPEEFAVTITSPADGAAFTPDSPELVGGKIPVTGTVNDPSVATTDVVVGVLLPETVLFGNPAKTGASTLGTPGSISAPDVAQYGKSSVIGGGPGAPFSYRPASEPSLWHATTVVAPGDDAPGNPLWYYGIEPQNSFNTPGFANAGALDTATMTIQGTSLEFKTWYDTEGGDQFDRKLIQFCETGGACTTLAQIIDFPPVPPAPGEFPQPGKVYPPDSLPGKSWAVVFIPNFWVAGPMPAPDLVAVTLDLSSQVGKTGFIRFLFDSWDPWGNDGRGWLVDDVKVLGAGFVAASDITVNVDPADPGQLLFTAKFPLAEGENAVTASATRKAYDPILLATKTNTVYLDSKPPQVTLSVALSSTMLGALVVYPTKTPAETVSGSYVEDNPKQLDMSIVTSSSSSAVAQVQALRRSTCADGKITAAEATSLNTLISSLGLLEKPVFSKKVFDATTTFSQIVSLGSGYNLVMAVMEDKGGLFGCADLILVLDVTAPTLTVLPVIYPVGNISARQKDPVVFQVTAADDFSGVKTVEFVLPGSGTTQALEPVANIPGAVRDQWQISLLANYVLPILVPSGTPPGTFSLNIKATDASGNVAVGQVQAVIVATLQAFNIYLMPGFNLVSMPLQPDASYDTVAEVLEQVVPNVNPDFQAVTGISTVKLKHVVESVTWWSGGVSGVGAFKGYFTASPLDSTVDPFDDVEFTAAPPNKWNVGNGFWVRAREFLKNPATGDVIWINNAGATGTQAVIDGTPGARPVRVFKQSEALLPGATGTPAPIKATIGGQFLAPGAVPPTFNVVDGWNLVGLHSEKTVLVSQFLRGLTVPTVKWSSLLTYDNEIVFPFEEGAELQIYLGVFRRLTETDNSNPGEGFWLFTLAGVITP
ncbi:MAG: hypothetical protein HYY00_08830 [Chloroflexi bacterium]|nr:hypothetical protein [Chloroflexota bacterium]